MLLLQPDWWTLINQRASTPKGNALGSSSPLASTPKASAGTPRQSLSQPSSTDDAGQWNSLEPSGKRPPPRYEHAVASLGSSMFVVGGNCSAALLSDSPLCQHSAMSVQRDFRLASLD